MITVTVAGTDYEVPSSAADTNWAADQVAFEQALAAAINRIFKTDATPTISSGFGSSPSVTANNGPIAFRINVGTGGVASTGVIALPAATTGWVLTIQQITTNSANVFVTKQTDTTTTTATIGCYDAAGAAHAWVASDILLISAVPF